MPKKQRCMKNSIRGKATVKRPLIEKDEDDDNQVYGITVKSFGSSVFEVKCYDGKIRKCVARQSKKKMNVEAGLIVIVGIRTFLSNDDSGDIIYVYDHDEARLLQKTGAIPSEKGVDSMTETVNDDEDTAFVFEDL